MLIISLTNGETISCLEKYETIKRKLHDCFLEYIELKVIDEYCEERMYLINKNTISYVKEI